MKSSQLKLAGVGLRLNSCPSNFNLQTNVHGRPCHLLCSQLGRTQAAVVSRQKLLKSPVVQVKNKMVPMGDYFYEITLEDVEFVNLIARTMF